MGFMDDMMAAKRTADSHANLKATEAIAEAQAEQLRIAQMQAAENAHTNRKLIAMAIDEKVDKLEIQILKDSIFHYEQILDVVQSPKSPIVQYHILNGFKKGAMDIFAEAAARLTEISDKREADALRKKWQDLIGKLDSIAPKYESSSLKILASMETRFEGLEKEVRGANKIRADFQDKLAKGAIFEFSQLNDVAQAAVLGFSPPLKATRSLPEKELQKYLHLMGGLNEEERKILVEVADSRKSNSVLSKIIWIDLPVSIILMIIGGVNYDYKVLAGFGGFGIFAFIVMLIVRIIMGTIVSNKSFRLRKLLSTRFERGLSSAIEESNRILESEQEKFHEEYRKAVAEFPEFEKFQSEAISVHQAFIKASLAKQTAMKQKVRDARR